jgi:hypothetical protein
MHLNIHKIQVWSGEVPDRPGAAAGKLEVLNRAGANLSFLFTRPHPHKAHLGMIFLAPIVGLEQTRAAQSVGLTPASDVALLVVEGENRPGIAYQIMSHLAVAGINLQGLSISAVGDRFAAYLAFDNCDVATQALQLLATLICDQ